MQNRNEETVSNSLFTVFDKRKTEKQPRKRVIEAQLAHEREKQQQEKVMNVWVREN